MTKRGSRVPGFKGSSGKPDIRADEKDIGLDVEFGPGVKIRCRKVLIEPGCRVGLESKDSFRFPAGVRVECDELELGAGCVIDRAVLIEGGRLRFGPGCRVGAGSTIRVKQALELGSSCRFGQENVVEGRHITIGRELWTGPQVRVGGGSCFEVQSELIIGYWCHLGMRVFVNTARRVVIGNEVGIGTDSVIFTHGAYQSALDGYPVSFAPVEIGDKCWIPGAVINPGVKVGRGAVIGVGSVVTKDVPAECLAAGVPCRVLKENVFPRRLSAEECRAFLSAFLESAAPVLADLVGTQAVFEEPGMCITLPGLGQVVAEGPWDTIPGSGLGHNPNSENRIGLCPAPYVPRPGRLVVQQEQGDETHFDFTEKTVTGPANPVTEKLRDLLRRHGVRFFAEVREGEYHDWRQG